MIEGKPVLVSGLHRLEAFKVMGRDTIPARLSNAASDDEARLEEVLENLARNELIALDRCHHLYELKQAYERLHPEARHGGDRKSEKIKVSKLDFDPDSKREPELFGFAETVADQIGLSRASIFRAISIWRGLSDESKARVVGTEVAGKQSDLRLLAVESAELQAKALDLYFREEASSISDAITLAKGGKLESGHERLYRAVEGNWQRFHRKQKRAFVQTHRDELLALLSEVDG